MLQLEKVLHEGAGLNEVRQLFIDYSKELDADLTFQSFTAELDNPLKKYGAPHGCLYIAYWNNEPAGCVALQALQPGICEMKRLFVKPPFRKHKIGKALANLIIEAGTKLGYTVMVLDTLERLQPAIDLYKQLGFIEVPAYYANPLPGVIYLRKSLGK